MFNEIKTDKAPKAIGPYSQGIMVGNVFYASGAVPIDPVTGNIPEGITAQAEQALKNVGGLLSGAGLTYKNVVRVLCFLADMNDFAAFNEVYAKYFSESPKPARSCVAVKTIPKNCLCEIEVTAIKD